LLLFGVAGPQTDCYPPAPSPALRLGIDGHTDAQASAGRGSNRIDLNRASPLSSSSVRASEGETPKRDRAKTQARSAFTAGLAEWIG